MNYYLKFKEKGKRNWWHMTLNCNTDLEAIKEAEEYCEKKGIERYKVSKPIYREKVIFETGN